MTITPSTPVPSTTAPWSDLEAGLLTIRVSNTGNIARIRRATAGGQVIGSGPTPRGRTTRWWAASSCAASPPPASSTHR